MPYARDPAETPPEIIDYGPDAFNQRGVIRVPVLRKPVVAVIDSEIPLDGNRVYAPAGQTALVTTAPVRPDRTLLYVALGLAALYVLTHK